MTNPFSKVRPGESFQPSASFHNATIDAVLANMRRGGKPDPVKGEIPGEHVLVENNTGKDLDRYDIIGIDGPVFELGDEKGPDCSVLKAALPDAEKHKGRFAVTQEPIPDGETGRAVIIGITPVRIKSDDNATPGIAVLESGETGFLVPGQSGGAAVLWNESGEGLRWAIILLGGAAGEAEGERLAIVTKAITRPSSLDDVVPDGRGEIRFVGVTETASCACEELVGDEVLRPGTVVKVKGPYDGKEGDNSVTWYSAFDTPGRYEVRLRSKLSYKGTATINIPETTASREEFIATVHDAALRRNEVYYEGDPVFIKRSGDRLIVYDGPCPGGEGGEA